MKFVPWLSVIIRQSSWDWLRIRGEGYKSKHLPLDKLLSAAHIIRLSGEIVHLQGGKDHVIHDLLNRRLKIMFRT